MENNIKTENSPSPSPSFLSLNKQRFPLSSLEMVFGSLIILGLIYIGYVLFFQDSTGSVSKLEKKVKNLEISSREQGIKFENRIKAIQDSQAQWEARLKALENVNRTKSPELVKIKPAKAEEKKPPSAAPVKKQFQHKVKKGETLQSIAAKYKVSTNDLLQWNKRSKKKPVQPGEVLTIVSQ